MATIHLHQTTTSTPEQFIAGLTDFGPGRSKLFGNSADDYLKVHDQGPNQADVTEGSNGIWERLHYDWSDPNRVRPHDHRLQRVGRQLGVTRTGSRGRTTGRPTLTLSWSGRARTSRDEHSGSWSESSASACWKSSWARQSRRSKPGTVAQRPTRLRSDASHLDVRNLGAQRRLCDEQVVVPPAVVDRISPA